MRDGSSISPRRRASRRGRRALSIAVLLVAVALSWWAREGGRDDPPWAAGRNGESARPGREGKERSRDPDGSLLALEQCTLVEDRANDGDSFLVDPGNGEAFLLRLYFVDCPEKYRHPRGYNADRIAEQGRYFGGLPAEETIAVGEAARDFTLERLRGRSFRVFTSWEPVYDSDRVYGFVQLTKGPDHGRFLSELLVGSGLARIHTKGRAAPDGTGRKEFEARLREIEREARRHAVGAWSGKP